MHFIKQMKLGLDPYLIKDLPPFADMDQYELSDFLATARSLRIEKGATVFSQGDKAEEFFLLLDGHIRVVKLTPDGEQVVPRYISCGELFGIAKALSLNTYPASSVAVDDCVVLSWSNTLWHDLIKRHPTFATNTYKMIGERLVETQQQMVELATTCVEQRVANAILRLVSQTGRQTEDGILIDFPISRQDLSE